ncbi:MAG: hypothetical protein HGA37_03325 [Lentimicrobium sp.]|nr:hypothetical protein [Lentimicrobium sp.]
MKRFYEQLNNHPAWLIMVILLLLPFALFINLGLMPLISDEPTRGIVTLEMIFSGNYITPTINGEFYYNKPPLYNWILAGFVQLSGMQSEFIFRLPTVLSLLIMGLVIYLFTKKELGSINAFAAALMLITSARILFWDSFQGLIDITYSLVTFCSFIVLYHFSQKKNYLAMFILSYALAATGFLMKGLPSVAFQGISLIVWMLNQRTLKKLFTWQHLAGIGVFVLITGSYYIAYLQTNSLQDVFSTLFDQSNRINNKEGTFLSWIIHLLLFPFEMSFEFAPWTLLLLLLIDKKIRHAVFQDKFSRFSLLIFATNIIIYWVSADMRPRYLFMLFPLMFFIGIKAYSQAEITKPVLFRIVNIVFLALALTGTASILIYPFWDETRWMSGVLFFPVLLFVISLIATILTIKIPGQRILLLIIVLLSVRMGFNIFNLPARLNSYPDALYRQGEIKAGQLSKEYDLYILGDTPFNHDASFYISRERGAIVTRTHEIYNKQACYITDQKNLSKFASRIYKYEVLHKFSIKLDETRLFLIKKRL